MQSEANGLRRTVENQMAPVALNYFAALLESESKGAT